MAQYCPNTSRDYQDRLIKSDAMLPSSGFHFHMQTFYTQTIFRAQPKRCVIRFFFSWSEEKTDKDSYRCYIILKKSGRLILSLYLTINGTKYMAVKLHWCACLWCMNAFVTVVIFYSSIFLRSNPRRRRTKGSERSVTEEQEARGNPFYTSQ